MEESEKNLEYKTAILNKKFGDFVITLSNEDTELEKFAKMTRLLLEQRELLRYEATFLSLVSVVREVPGTKEHTLATELTPKNVILYLLDILQHFMHTPNPSNEDSIRNVVELLIFIFSFGPPLPPVDRYFDSGTKVPSYGILIKNVESPSQLFQTDEFLNSMSCDVTSIYEKGTNLVGGIPWRNLAFEACRLARGYDPLMRHFDTPVANLFRIPISFLSTDTTDVTQIEITLRLIAASPSLFIDLDETPQPKLSTLVSLLNRTHSHLSVCLCMTSCLYRLFVVSELSLDACLDDNIITPLMEEFAYFIRNYIGKEEETESQLLRMVFKLLKFMTTREEFKLILSGQPAIIKECIYIIQECRFESVFAVGFMNSISGFLSKENIGLTIGAVCHCLSHVSMKIEFQNYFNSVSLNFLILHGLSQEDPSNQLNAKEFIKYSSSAIIGLSDNSFLQLGLKVIRILFDYPGIQGDISNEFIGAFSKLFLESVRLDSEDLIGLFSYLLCDSIMEGATKEIILIFKESELLPHIIKLFVSEERVEYLSHFTRILKYTVASYEKVGLEFSQLKDVNIVEKLAGLLMGENCINQDPGSVQFNDLQGDTVSILWAFSCDVSYCEDTFLPSQAVTKLIQVLRDHIADIDNMLIESYVFRGTAHILSNLSLKKETNRLEMAETGICSDLFLLLLQLLESVPVPWIMLDATLRLMDTITADEIYKLELMDYGLVDSLISIILLEPNSTVLTRALETINGCASISNEHKHSICTPLLLEYLVELLRNTRDGRLYCISSCLITTLADTQLGARYVSHFDIFSQLLGVREDHGLIESCNQVGRWGLNLLDKVFLNCVSLPRDITLETLGQRAELSQLRKEHFVVDRMMGVVRQGCMNCESRERDSCTKSESLSSEELCIFCSSLSLYEYQQLVNRGWYRRGGDRMYRWSTKLDLGCVDWETRVRVKEFSLKQRKSFSRVMKKIPKALTVDTVPARFTEDGHTLYNEYNLHKHGKSRVSKESYIEHVVDTCVPTVVSEVEGLTYGTFHQEYRVAGELVAIGVIDIIPEGLVSIYFYYKMRRDVTRLSLGKYSSLREIQLAQELGALSGDIQYYYLQGWNRDNPKLSYKADYKPVEFLGRCVSPEWTEEPDTVPLTPLSDGRFRSLEVDRLDWELHSPPLSVSSVRIYVSGVLITFQEFISVATLEPEQSETLRNSLEHLCYALGPRMTSHVIVQFHTSLSLKTEGSL